MERLTRSLKAMFVLVWLPLTFKSPITYIGKLNAELVPERSSDTSIHFAPATEPDLSKLATPLGADEKAFIRKVKWPPKTGALFTLLLVEPANGKPYLYADVNQD